MSPKCKPSFLLAWLAILGVLPLHAADLQPSGTLYAWQPISLTFAGPFAAETDTNPNPFLDYRLEVTFSDGHGFSYTVPGFFAADGNAANSGASEGDQWRVYFAPDMDGTWTWEASFVSGDNVAINGNNGTPVSSIDGMSGSFTVAPMDTTAPGFYRHGRLGYVDGHHLQFLGSGEYFLKIGADAPENFLGYREFDNTCKQNNADKNDLSKCDNSNSGLKDWQPHVGDWNPGDPTWSGDRGKGIIGALNYLAEEEQNAFSFLPYNAGGDGKDVWPFIHPDEPLQYDVSKLDQWNIVFTHAQTKGLYLHFKLQETENDNDGTWGLDQGRVETERKLYYRELIARFGHHLALNWNLGEENTQTTTQRQQMAQFIRDTDPYDHHIVIHTYPNQQDSVYTPLLGNASELTGASLQNRWDQTHKRTLKWVEESAQAGKPWVVANDEQGNANTGAPPDIGYRGYTGTNVSQDDIRHQTLWGNIMAGGAGVEYYFGYQQPCDDLDCEDYRSRDNLWDYNRHALRFFSENDVPFWAMDNCNGLIGNGNDNATPGYCLGQTGSVYAVYLAKGFADAGDLNLGNAGGGTFEVYWYDPRNGGSLQLGSVTAVPGSGTVDLGNPPSSPNQDWVVLVQRGDGTPLPNQAPNVNAGPNRSLTLPNTTTTLNGSVNDDGKPDGVLDIVWTQIAGPSGATLVSPMSPVTEVSFSQAGSYEFELFASDGELDTVDTVSVSVAEAGSSDLGFELVDADTDQVVKPLGDGETIDLNAYPLANFNVVLINTPSNTGSVRFTLSGAGSKVQVENVIPYAAIGNNGADYDEQPAVVGSYQLRAEVFGGSNASGTLLDDITLGFAFDDSVEVPNQDPVASIAANPTQGTAPLTVNFNASASGDSDGTIVNYAWAFGDGNRASGATTSHVYTTPGNYTATLTVTDDDGATASAAVAIDVAEPANQGPMANVSATPTQGTAPLTVAFDASASEDSDGTIAAYAWSFGDGSSGTGATTNHVYTTPGNYTATLTVTDDDGATASAAVDVIVDAPAGGSEGDVVVAVNSGGPAFTAADGTVYSADQGSVGSSKTYNTSGSQAIAGTSDDVLYRSERYGKTFGYAFDVPPGNYQVELLLAEIYWNASGKRVFSATVEGESAVTDLDLHAEVGKFATYDVTVLVEVVDGTLNIDFTTAVNNAKLSAVVVRTVEPVEPPEPVEPTVELALIDATNGSTVAVVSDGATVDLVSAGLEQFSLSLLDPQTGTDSVDYLLKGPIDHSQVENISPYTLFGDQGGGASFTGRTALPGTYTLQVVEFAGGNASGEVLRDATLSFTFVEEQVVNQPPLILGDSFDVIWGESVLLDVLANDSDPDGDPLTLVALSDREGSLQGQVAIEDNQVRYTPPPGSGFGFDVFAYDVTDGSVVVEEIVVFVYLDDPQTVGDGVYAANANGNFAFEAEEALNVDEQTNWLVKTGADLISGHEAPSGNGYLEATQNSLGNPPNSPALVYAFEVQQDGFVRLNLLGSYQGNDPTEENDTWVGLKSPGGNFIRALDQEVPLDQKGGMYKSYQSGGKETQWRAANRNVDNNPQPIVMAVQGGQVYEMHLKSRSRGHQVDRVVVEFLQNRPGIQSFTSLGQIKTEPLSPLR